MSYQRHEQEVRRQVRRMRATPYRERGEMFLDFNPVTGAFYVLERLGGAGSGDVRTVKGPLTREAARARMEVRR